MDNQTLSCYVLDEMGKRGLTQNKVAAMSGINKGNLTKYLKGAAWYTLDVVDKLVDAIGLDRLTAYELYSKEVFRSDASKVMKKREDLLKRCIEHGFVELAERVASAMLEEGSTAIGFYRMAEEYRLQGKESEALGLYDKAMSLETDRYSELLALCLYRKFSILRDKDLKRVYDVALEFSLYIKNLPSFGPQEQAEKLEAYRKLIATFYELKKYDHMLFYCDELAELTTKMQGADERTARKYHGYSKVYKGFALRATKRYPEALAVIEEYRDNDTDNFSAWATSNNLYVRVEMGEVEAIPEMLEFVKKNPMNSTGVILSLQTYLSHGKIVDAGYVVETYREQIDKIINSCDMFYQTWQCDLFVALSEYYRIAGQKEKAKACLIDAIRASLRLCQHEKWLHCIQTYNAHYIEKSADNVDYFELLSQSGKLFNGE